MSHPTSFRKYQLNNGLTVYWQRRNITWDALSVVVWAGYRYERPEAVQVVHVLEHLMTCGTEGYDYPVRDLVKYRDWCLEQGFLAEDAGAWLDAMEFHGHTTARQHLPALVRFMAALVLRPTLNRGLEKELGIIAAENVKGVDEVHRTHQRAVYEAMFGEHFIIRHDTRPQEAEVYATTMAMVREHHARLFHPANMALVVVSGHRFEEMRGLLEKAFVVNSEFTPSPEPPRLVYPPVPAAPVRTGLSHRRKCGIELEYNWCLPVGRLPYLEISRRLIESLLTSRIREKLRATYEVETSTENGRDYAYLNVAMDIRKAELKRVMAAVKSALSNRRAIEACVEPELRSYIHEGRTIDLDALAAIEWAVDYVGKKVDPPRPSVVMKRRLALRPEDISQFILEHFRLDQAVIGILETDN